MTRKNVPIWNYPEESIQHSEHGESLKSRMLDWFTDTLMSSFNGYIRTLRNNSTRQSELLLLLLLCRATNVTSKYVCDMSLLFPTLSILCELIVAVRYNKSKIV